MPFHLAQEGDGFVVMDDRGKKYSKKPLPKARAAAQMRALYRNVPDAKEEEVAHKEFYGGSLRVFKDASGNDRWILFSSNAYKDQDKEIVSMKALEEDVERAEKANPGHYGPLRWWHIPEASLGECDFRMVSESGKTLIESGTFRGKEVGQRVGNAAGHLQVSIGFNHPKDEPDQDGVYHNIFIFERSLLPAGKAANQYTKVMVKGVQPMATKEEKLKALKALGIDPEDVLAEADSTEKELDEKGTSYKEDADPEDPSPEGTAEETKEQGPEARLDEALTRAEALVEEIKARKKQPAPPADEADEETPDEEDMEAEMMAADEEPVIGNMGVEEFKATLKEAFQDALTPMAKMMEETNKAVCGPGKKKEATEPTTEQLMAKIASLEATLKELSGEMPRAAKGHVASQDASTVIPEEVLKELGVPEQDPFVSKFVGDFLNLK